MTIGGQSTRQFRRWEFACTAEEPIITRPWRKPSDVVLQGFAVAGVDRTKSQPSVRVPFHPPREELRATWVQNAFVRARMKCGLQKMVM
jgi:uncharacterized lipoprotein YddW (UPF0748 family)